MKPLKLISCFLLSVALAGAFVCGAAAEPGRFESGRPAVHREALLDRLFFYMEANLPAGACLGGALDGAEGSRETAPVSEKLVPGCLIEAADIAGGLWDLAIGVLTAGEESPECSAVASTGRALYVVETLMAYRICVLKVDEEADEALIENLQLRKKLLMVIDEFLYIFELLACRSAD